MATQYLSLAAGGATWAPRDLTAVRALTGAARMMTLTGGRMTASLVSAVQPADPVYSQDGAGGPWTTSAYPP